MWLDDFLIFLLSALRVVSEIVNSEIGRGFFFSKIWFYSLIFFAELRILKSLKIFSRPVFFVPISVFALSPFLDSLLFFRRFDEGIPVLSLPRSIISFFVLVNVPKVGLILLFVSKLVVFLIKRFHGRTFNFLIYFLISYLMWNIAHVNLIYSKLYIFSLLGFGEKVSFLLSGFIYFVVLSLIFFRRWFLDFLHSEAINLIYLFIISLLGYAISQTSFLAQLVLPFSSVLSFRMIEILVQKIGNKMTSHDFKVVSSDILELFLAVSLLSSSRGTFILFLPFVILLMFIYYVPPLELRRNILGSFLASIFYFFLLIVAYLSSKSGFFISSEAIAVGFACLLFSLFENLSRKVSGIFGRISAFLAAFSPSLFLLTPEDIAFGFVAGIIAFRFEKSKIPKILSALYFASKFFYLKYMMIR